ncbi:FAD-binding oxidoreductase [Actinomadura macrotermitis]|uniref:Mitomycin radical oxidase n=1 Tax=Actinomadura macrotermitis TaxID=2585200 RepID=A0A7K0BVH5_9ACTN|nr:FAD-binding protein [Actinomadura macrotermitis]MQY05167.1 Mitomycin radical oxidase [Actinomadura macrotermitis]
MRILTPADPGFDQARRPWNLAVDQPVQAVAEAADAADVAAALAYARANGLAVTAQPSGHGASGDVDGVLLLRTAGLDELEIRPDERIARVGAGIQWGQVLAAAGEHGLIGLAGSSPVVSVTGYTLGGGLSWFSRKHGNACDAVRAFDVVTADGAEARITADSDPDLFWALRGGGGDFALVTAIEFELFPAPHLFGGRMLWSGDRTPEVLAAFQEITADAPEELTLWLELLHFPGAPPMVAIDATYLGEEAAARALLRPLDGIPGLISDSRARMRIADLGTITAEPTDPSPGVSRGELLSRLDAEALLSAPIAPLLSVQIRHLGGALARPSDSAAGPIAEPYALYMFGIPSAGDIAARQREMADALGDAVTGRKPYNFLAPHEPAALAFAPDTLDRLRKLKEGREIIRANHPVVSK